MLYFITHRHLVLDHQQGIKKAGVTLINDAVGMADMFNDLIAYPLV